MNFLLNSGFPEAHKNEVNINTNGSVYIRGLENDVCQNLIEIFSGLKYGERSLTCTGLVPLTPTEKVTENQNHQCEVLDNTVIDASLVTETAYISNVTNPASLQIEGQESVNSDFSPGAKQLERRRSVRDLVTDFSSCLSNLSSEEDTSLSWVGSGGRRKKKKKRGASSSPKQDTILKKVNSGPSPK